MPLDFSEEVITWVALELSGSSGALGAEALKLKNWLLRFGCALEEKRFEVAGLSDFLVNSSTSWSAYISLMAYRIVVLNNLPEVCPVGIGETLRRSLSKLAIRAVGDPAKVTCRNLKL